MKKFLSICLVALCSVSAMYAQTTTPTPSEPTQADVECGSPVTMTATPKPHYHFTQWVMTDNNSTTHTYTVAGSNTEYTCATDATGKNTLTITLSPTMIGYAQNGELVFKAIFNPNSYTIDATTEGSGTVSGTGTIIGNSSLTLTATPDDCSEVSWVDPDGNTIPGDAGNPNQLTITPKATWVDGNTYTYKAVFVKKTVTIKVTTDDPNQGTVGISVTNQQ